MIIGVLADTHDNITATKKAVEFFAESKVDLIVHVGDVVAPFALEAFMGLKIPLKGVFGNNDGDKTNLNRKLEEIDAEFKDFVEFECDGKKVAAYHGTHPQILDALIKSQKYDILITAHTHQPETTLDENTLIVNPGETCGYLTGVQTVALVDTIEMKAEIKELK
jgi:putative phosphoesterase